MEKDKRNYEPSPSEVRAAEASMSDTQREFTEIREDAYFEGRKDPIPGYTRTKAPTTESEPSKPIEIVEEVMEEHIEVPIEPEVEKPEKPDKILKERLEKADTIDDIKSAIKTFKESVEASKEGAISPIDYDQICELIEDTQADNTRISIMTNKYGIQRAVRKVLGLSGDALKPHSKEAVADKTETGIFYQAIPLRGGAIISGTVKSTTGSAVVVEMPDGSQREYKRSDLLNQDAIYSLGSEADRTKLKSLQEQVPSERKEIFKDIEKELVFVAHGEGCVGNINRSFADFAHQHQELLEGIRGKKVLIKINAVDPSSPDACTSSESLRATIENLLQYGPAEICIGDQPADQFMNGPDGKKIGSQELFRQFREKLGYDFLGEYPGVRFIDFRSELQVPDPERPEDARMYDLSEFQTIFSLSLPKAHGQLDFTGCRKNIVGLLPQAERNALLHPHGDSMLGWLDRNTPAMQRISDTYTARNPRTVYVMDGFKTIMGHEHEGVPRVSDFAIVSMDPYNADLLASTLSFSPNVTQAVEYLHKIPILENADKIEGSVPESANKSFNERRVVYAGQTAEGKPGGATYAITDPEIEETTIKSIEERLELVKNLESIDNFDEVIKNLRISGSDRAIKCLLRISELTNDTNLLITIFYSVYLPIVSSRGLSSEYSNNVIPNEQLANDELLKRFASFEKRIMDLGIRL